MPRRKKVHIELNGIAGKLGAEVYSESPGFVCVLPNDINKSVVGRGGSVAEAVSNWDSKLQAHLRNAADDDPVVIYVKGHIDKLKEPDEVDSVIKGQTKVAVRKTREQNIAEFEAQFYPRKKK